MSNDMTASDYGDMVVTVSVACVCGNEFSFPVLGQGEHAHCPNCGSIYDLHDPEKDLVIFRINKGQVKCLQRHWREWQPHAN